MKHRHSAAQPNIHCIYDYSSAIVVVQCCMPTVLQQGQNPSNPRQCYLVCSRSLYQMSPYNVRRKVNCATSNRHIGSTTYSVFRKDNDGLHVLL